jgi:hypothetical protein
MVVLRRCDKESRKNHLWLQDQVFEILVCVVQILLGHGLIQCGELGASIDGAFIQQQMLYVWTSNDGNTANSMRRE